MCYSSFMSTKNPFPKIPKDQVTPIVADLLEIIQLQKEEIQLLRDEIARLKNQKPKPKIKPSKLEPHSSGNKTKKNKKRRKKAKNKKIEIHEHVPIKPDNLPAGSTFKGYQDYIVQDILFDRWNICYRRERWQTPSGEYVLGQLPDDVAGSHFGSTMTAFILYQYYGCHVTQPQR